MKGNILACMACLCYLSTGCRTTEKAVTRHVSESAIETDSCEADNRQAVLLTTSRLDEELDWWISEMDRDYVKVYWSPPDSVGKQYKVSEEKGTIHHVVRDSIIARQASDAAFKSKIRSSARSVRKTATDKQVQVAEKSKSGAFPWLNTLASIILLLTVIRIMVVTFRR